MRSRGFKFKDTDEIVDLVREAAPDHRYITPIDRDYPPSSIHEGRRVTWIGNYGYLVEVPSENINFMEGNTWNFEHAAALLEGIVDQTNWIFEVPSARVYRVRASDVKSSQRYDRNGELDYQLDMTSPWQSSDIGSYYAQLLDGNHRAAAALAAGEASIYVYVGENTRENVYKKDFV